MQARGRTKNRGKSQDRNGRSKSRSKKDVECDHCGKKGHLKKQCWKLKAEKKEGKQKADASDDSKAIVPHSKKSSVKIEELNYVSDGSHCSSNLLFTSTISAHSLHAGCLSDLNTWLIDSGASFHVTPFKNSFCKYRVRKFQYVYLGDNHVCCRVSLRRARVTKLW